MKHFCCCGLHHQLDVLVDALINDSIHFRDYSGNRGEEGQRRVLTLVTLHFAISSGVVINIRVSELCTFLPGLSLQCLLKPVYVEDSPTELIQLY